MPKPKPQTEEELQAYLEGSDAGLVDGKRIIELEGRKESRVTFSRETYRNLLLLQAALGYGTLAEMLRVAAIAYYAQPGNQAAIGNFLEVRANERKGFFRGKVLGYFKRIAREKRVR